MIVIRGMKPSRVACLATEKAPEMTACDAITVATVARITIGSCAHCGKSKKNGLLIDEGVSRISEPWPM